jgi:V/A-type H+/Na+-transporting ATPase subunit E
MPVWGHVELLCRAVIEEGSKEAAKLIAEAQAEAERKMAKARESVDRELDKEFSIKKRLAYAEAARMVDSAELEAKKRIMSFRQQVIQEILGDLKVRLAQIPEHPEYKRFLLSAVREGIQALPGKRLVVKLSNRDLELVQEETAQLAVELDVEIELERMESSECGPRIYTSDGRLMFDNTLSARLKRRDGAIRREIWRTMLGND